MKLCLQRTDADRREGMILLLVLVVVVALSVAAYSFSRHMLRDLAITQSHLQSTQQKLLSDSVVEQLTASDRRALHKLCVPYADDNGSLARNSSPSWRVGQQSGLASVKLAGGNEAQSGYMAILATDPRSPRRQLGLQNESAKLNLNSLTGRRLSRQQAIAKLMKYQDLSESTAEGIANVLGVFDSQSSFSTGAAGGENSAPPAPASRLTSLLPLLNVPGVSEELLLGEDRNANGILDENENDGDASWPPDNADDVLDAGWSADWTLIAAESNYQDNGARKIDLNQSDLVALYDQVSQFATPEEARFVVAWRMSSPVYTDVSGSDDARNRAEAANELATSFDERLAKQLGTAPPPKSGTGQPGATGKPAPKTRAGLNLAMTPARKLRSLLDLASCQLQLIIEGKDTVLVSPFPNDPAGLARWLNVWEAKTTVSSGDEDNTRINIMQASATTLATVDGISSELAAAIVRQRAALSPSDSFETFNQSQSTTVAWLLEAGLVTTSELRRIADEITVGGDVFQGYAVGQLSTSRTANVRFVELDARGPRIKVRRAIELMPLSSGDRLRIEP